MTESSSPSDRKYPDHIKVLVRVQQDEDGYPGVEVEGLWCTREGDHFRVDNIPFFAPGIACGDVLRAARSGEELWAEAIISESGHATVWVYCQSEAFCDEVRASAKALGCSSELSHLPTYVAIDVPREVNRENLRQMLETGENGGKWEYAESVAL